MTSSTISLRRVAAVAAIAGVSGLGAVALAPSALADPMKPTATPSFRFPLKGSAMNTLTTMLGSGLRSVRTLGLVTAVAGVAVVGLSTGAPSSSVASAAGPDAFVQTDHGVVPIFFCDPEKPNAHHNTDKHPYKCYDLDGPRF